MPRRDIASAVREEYAHREYISEEIVTAQDYYIDNNESNRISINTNIIEPRTVEYGASITVNNYWYDTIKPVQILTEENAIDFLKEKGYAVYKKVMETE